MPTGTAAWNGVSGTTVNTQTLAESSTPTGNATLSAASVSVTGAGSYGYNATSTTNACYYIQTSTNATNGVNQLATAITTGAGITSISVSYDIRVISSNAGIMGLVLQYRAGTSGSWTTVSGSALSYNNSSSNGGDADSAGDTDTYNFAISGLTASTAYQFRWASWKGTGTASGLGIDNLSFTAAIVSSQTGNWSNTATWVGGVVPTSSQNAVIATGHTVTMDSDTYATRSLGTTTVVNTGGTLLTNKNYINNGSTTINGSFQLDAGGWVSDIGGTNALVYGTSGTLIFNTAYGANNGNYWPTTSGPVNVTVNTGSTLTLGFARTVTGLLQTSSTITNPGNITIGPNGTLQLNAGYGFSGTGSPVYGTASLLKYNSGGSPGRGAEWTQSAGTVGTTAGLPQNVQISNTTTLNFPNGSTAAFKANGNLTIDSGSALYQNYSGGSAALIVGGNLVLNGSLGLGSSVGGDLFLAGNWTKAVAANFYPNDRAVEFNGSVAQTITGDTTFDYLTLNNAAGLTLSSTTSSIIVNQKLTFTAGKITLGANNLTVSSTGTISGNDTSKYVVTNGTGQLKQTVGSAAVAFPVGSATAYNPITFTNAGTSDVYGVILTAGTVPNVSDATLTVNDRWLVSEAVSGGSNLTVVPQWNTADVNTAANFNAGTQLYVGFYNGSAWTQNTAALSGTNPYTATGAAAFAPTNLTTGTQYFAVGKDNAFVCSASPIPYSQGFNSATIPACWSTSIVAVQGGTKISFLATSTNPTTSPQEGSQMVQYNSFSSTNGGAGSEERLASLPLSSIGSGSVDVNFQWRNENKSTYSAGAYLNEGVQVQYSLDGSTWTDVSGAFFARHDGSLASGAAQWNLKRVTLPVACANVSKFYVGFKFHSEVGDNQFLDAVKVETSPPTLFVNGISSATLAFGSNDIGTSVATQSFSLSGANLTGFSSNITVTAPNTDFQLSSDAGTTWGASVNVPYTTEALAAQNILVKYIPTTCGAVSSGNIIFSGGGVSIYPTVAVSGTALLAKPINVNATDITATTFTANWTASSGATGYELDVYNKTSGTSILINGFDAGTTPPSAWTYTGIASTYTSATNYGLSSPSISFDTTTDKVLTPVLSGSATELKFWIKGQGTASTSEFRVRGWDSVNSQWVLIQNITNSIPTTGTTITYNTSTTPALPANITQFEFYYNLKTSGNVALDDVNITYNSVVETPVSGYNPKVISGASNVSQLVTGLTPNTQYYYRVRAANGSCESANSEEKTVTTNNTVVWNGSAWSNTAGPTAALDSKIAGLYNVAASFETNNMEITSTGSLDIQANKDVIVNGNITLPSDGKIILESDANLVQKNTGADSNSDQKITVKRTALLPTKGYTFWSSPVVGQKLYSFSNGYNQALGAGTGTPWNRFFVYKESTDTFVTAVSGEITLDSNSEFAAGRGYAIKGKNSYTPTGGTGTEVPGAADTFVFDGKMNNGPISSQALKNSCLAAVSEAACTKGYNMIGNPYPSNLDFDALYAANNSKIYGTAYFWTNNDITATASQSGSNYNGNNYAVYNLTGGTPAVDHSPFQPDSPASPTPNGRVKVGQGFIIKAKKAGAGSSLDFTNAMRSGYEADAHFYNAKKTTKNRFWIKMTTPTHIINTALVGYLPGATNGFEIDYDGELFVVGTDAFYSTLDSKKLIIQGKAEFINDDIVPLGLKYAANGNYKISLGDKEGIFGTDQKIYLKDKVTNTYTDLTSQDYTFSAIKGTDESRFEIVYKNLEVLGTNELSKSDFIVYRDGDSYVVKSSKALGKIEIYDASGRMLITSSTKENTIKINTSILSNGVYLLRAENSGDVKTKKIIK